MSFQNDRRINKSKSADRTHTGACRTNTAGFSKGFFLFMSIMDVVIKMENKTSKKKEKAPFLPLLPTPPHTH